ncbi:hypothetical protein G7Y89_g10449 [Cudoniella acicularis]|uniref:Purple acid phosphatase n=1 Tax=Cudoniella acicularis TaxID=354080 RepID=A0A8H4VZ69_9HELO|nr:hypothetical protein G7Y89_g10449 [Cudoniella acicularis]
MKRLRNEERITKRFSQSGVELVRFTNSGTEANTMAIAVAIAFTGRKKIIVFSNGYHGGTLYFANNLSPTNVNLPHEFVICPYNDIPGTKEIISSLPKDSLAAILVEPIQGSGGCIIGTSPFLRYLETTAHTRGALFIVDEVMTSRLYYSGLSSSLGLKPDIVTLGKWIGGGMTFGAFGGRTNIMSMFDPRSLILSHSGTFNNNIVTMAAGCAGMEIYSEQKVKELNALGETLRKGIEEILSKTNISSPPNSNSHSTTSSTSTSLQKDLESLTLSSQETPGKPKIYVTGQGSMLCIHFSGESEASLRALFWHFLLEKGIYIAQRAFVALSLPITSDHVEKFVEAVGEFVTRRKRMQGARGPNELLSLSVIPKAGEVNASIEGKEHVGNVLPLQGHQSIFTMLFSSLRVLGSATLLTSTALAAVDQQQHQQQHKNDCNAKTDPTQIRLAYANGDSGMSVSWNTNQKLNNPTVCYGCNHPHENCVSSDQSVTYATSSTWNNHVVISGLQADTKYQYRIQCDNETYSFTTARAVGNGEAFKFAMVGDMGTMGPDGLSTTVGTGAANPLKPGEKTSIDSLQAFKGGYDFVWHVGDIAYADAWLKEEKGGYIKPLNTSDKGAEYDKILNEFYVEVEEISSVVPYMVGVGNHEANCDNGADLTICLPGQTNFTGYRAHWNMPSFSSGGLENFWYSWNHGMVHFVNFNTETDFLNAPDEPGGEGAENAGPFAPSGAQLAWLKADLAAVDRKKTPWVIAAGHRPWYVSESECIECQTAFEPLLISYGVDLVLHGHKHFYERQSAIANNVTQEITNNPTAPWYIVNGAAGHYDGLDVPTTPFLPLSQFLSYYNFGIEDFKIVL